MRTYIVLLLSVIFLCSTGCRRGGGGGTPTDGDADVDGDSDSDGTGTEDPLRDEEVAPICRTTPCPDDLFHCNTQDDGEITCEGQRPVTPDRGEWFCDVAGAHALDRALFICSGSSMPANPAPWVCEEGEYSIYCVLDTYWPDAGDGPYWDCMYIGDNIMCSYQPGDPASCRTDPCPDNWFICNDYGDGEASCESAHPVSPGRGEWYCDIEGGHSLEEAYFVCNCSSIPADPRAWECEESEYGGVNCLHSAYWPDRGDDAQWDCSYNGEGIFCTNMAR